MDWIKLLQEIFEVCIVPLLGVLTTFVVKWIKTYTANLTKKSDNELLQKYITMLSNTIQDCVVATNQTYVNALKEKDAFDAQAQEEAFNKTFTAVKSILSLEAKEYLAEFYGDLDEYISERIETEVYYNK